METFDSLEGVDVQQLISTLDEGRKEENGKIEINIQNSWICVEWEHNTEPDSVIATPMASAVSTEDIFK